VKSLRIGCVKYLNARPLIFGWNGPVVFDHPSVLCDQLARGDLDVALVSSFEFLRNPIYRIVDGLSISSNGPVYSVVVAHQQTISDVEEIQLDPAAETSGKLLHCLLGELKLPVRINNRPASVSSGNVARLLIGDQAIRFRQEHEHDFHFWDLGEQWKKLTKLPFVYALWLIRPQVVDPKLIADQLRARCRTNVNNLATVIAAEKEFDHAFCRRYYEQHLRFSFGEEEKEGLRAFQRLCQQYALIPKQERVFNLA
jgi:chorismate dehydratase